MTSTASSSHSSQRSQVGLPAAPALRTSSRRSLSQGFVGLAIFAVILSVIGAFYYLRVVKVMYFDKAEDDTTLSVSADAQVLMGANGLAVMLLGVYPSGLMALCSAAIH